MPTKRPDHTYIRIKCPHCGGVLFLFMTPEIVDKLRKGFRLNVKKAGELWGRIRFRVFKTNVEYIKQPKVKLKDVEDTKHR
jgi:phage FluMu protein Com